MYEKILFWFLVLIFVFEFRFLIFILIFFYFETLVHLVNFTIEIYSDTRPCERQISQQTFI